MNVPVVWPAGTVTEAGTVAAALLLVESATTVPLGAAGPLNVTVPTQLFPPITVVGFRLIEMSAAGVTRRVADSDWPSSVAVMVETVCAFTPTVLTLKVH